MRPHDPHHEYDGALQSMQHWSPLVLLSLIANLGLLYLFAYLITVTEPHATDYNRLSVLLVQNEPKVHAEPPKPQSEVVKPPEPNEQIVEKTKPEKPKPAVKPPPPKKTVQAKTPPPSAPPPDRSDQRMDPEVTEVVEVQAPAATSEPKETPNISSQTQESTAPDPVPLFRLTRMPKMLSFNPEILNRYYPEEERDFGKEGKVEALILVDENGDIVEVEIIRSAGARFDAAAKKALLSKVLVMQPGYVGDKPVASRVSIPFEFVLTD